jgi:hypothetical protein
LHKNGCPWTCKKPFRNACEGASIGGHLECLEYAYKNGCPFGLSEYHAIMKNQKQCYVYILKHKRGVEVDPSFFPDDMMPIIRWGRDGMPEDAIGYTTTSNGKERRFYYASEMKYRITTDDSWIVEL